MRVGRQAGDFELEVDRRRDYLAGLAAAGVTDVDGVRRASMATATAPRLARTLRHSPAPN